MQDNPMVKIDFSKSWAGSVSAVARDTSLQVISGPADAYDFLCNQWPGPRGPAFAKARRAAMGALTGGYPAEDARSAFIAACLQGDCLVRAE